jgi:hypothetical protein
MAETRVRIPVAVLVTPRECGAFRVRSGGVTRGMEGRRLGGSLANVDFRTSRRAVVRGLNLACSGIDSVLYRPAVVKLTESLPRPWCCQLAHLSMRLDDRWSTGYWASPDAPTVPGGPCDICGRRAALFVVGGYGEPGEASSDEYLSDHSLELCGWCRLDFAEPPRSRRELDQLIAQARSRSVAWRWR